MNGPRSLLDIITERGTTLSDLARRAGDAARLADTVAAVVGEPIGAHVVSASLHDGTLTIIADSPVWAARLRFESARLIDGLGDSASVQGLAVKVRAPATR